MSATHIAVQTPLLFFGLKHCFCILNETEHKDFEMAFSRFPMTPLVVLVES